MVLMFATTFVDWLMSLVIAHDSWRIWGKPVHLLPKRARRSRLQHGAITTSVILNLVVLGFFKYFNFGVDSYNAVVDSLGWSHAQWDTVLRVVLPLGISFYTFQALSYTIDVYRGEAEAMANFIDFSCFVSMFPHLVAGPILKFSFLAEQLKHRALTSDKFARGVAFFMLGLAKKILLANPCGKIADTCFDAGSVQHARCLVRLGRLRLPNLFRFQRLLRHGDRAWSDARIRLREKFRFALPLGIDHRFLAALAHLALHLAARISLHPARRQSHWR